MLDILKLKQDGFLIINYFEYIDELLKIAQKLGEIVCCPNGKIVDKLKPKSRLIAKIGTFSYKTRF